MARKRTPPEEVAAPEPGRHGYTVLARRYRPQQFRDLVGQEAIAQALTNALKSNRVAHAYLFTGTRGVGKTSAARILAKALNCSSGPTPTPCDRCPACLAIAAGEDVDVLEIDGASNRNLDDIRELRQSAQYKPIQSRFKIYIIDEVHQLTRDAFNALLKTLEEPPPHVKFIFATTDVQKVPATILSRCQRYDFAGIGTEQIVERLRQIVHDEKAQAEDEALRIIARRAAHSMRDAQSLLDQCLAFAGPHLTADTVRQLLGLADEEMVVRLAAAVLHKKTAEALALLDQACERGVQQGELLDQLMAYWRDLLLMKTAGETFPGFLLSKRYHAELAEQARRLELGDILTGLDMIAAAAGRLRSVSQPRILLEVLLVRLSHLDEFLATAELLATSAGQPARPAPGTPPRLAVPASSDAVADAPSPLAEAPRPRDAHEPKAEVLRHSAPAQSPPSAAPLPWTQETLDGIWPQLLASVGVSLGYLLHGAVPVANTGPNQLVLRYPPEYNKLAGELRASGQLDKVQAELARLTGLQLPVRIEVHNAPDRAAPASDRPAGSRTKVLRQQALEEPLVRKAVDLFHAQLIHVDEGFAASRGDAAEAQE
jgi:DNA polymerase-3 subunit gamma/tau